jgi:hypothetical protein
MLCCSEGGTLVQGYVDKDLTSGRNSFSPVSLQDTLGHDRPNRCYQIPIVVSSFARSHLNVIITENHSLGCQEHYALLLIENMQG